jgi:hypothetical protein
VAAPTATSWQAWHDQGAELRADWEASNPGGDWYASRAYHAWQDDAPPAGGPQTPVVYGHQRPRIACIPYACSRAAGEETIDLGEAAGLGLDDWQRWSLLQAMGTQATGLWAAFEVGIEAPRQNGKNKIAEARQLSGLYLLGEELILHTAHEFKAASEHFLRMRTLIESHDWLISKTAAIRTSHGDETIEMRPTPTIIFGAKGIQVRKSVAPRLRFIARSRGSGRAFTCNTLFYDEAMILSAEQVGASLPTLSAVANPQVWYMGSAGMPDSTQLDMVRKRGVAGNSRALVWLEWSIDPHNDMCRRGCRVHDNRDDPQSWAKANPGLGIRISVEHVAREFDGMPEKEFDRERLGVGDWPPDAMGWAVIPEETWDGCVVAEPPRPRKFVAAVDVTPDQSAASIVIGSLVDIPTGITADATPPSVVRRTLVEIGQDTAGLQDHRAGTDWVISRLLELKARHDVRLAAVIIDKNSPAAVLLSAAENAGLTITVPTPADAAQACAQFYSAAGGPRLAGQTTPAAAPLAHFGQPDLRKAVAGAARGDVGDGLFRWTRKATTVDISPLCAATLALWGANKFARPYDPLKSIGGVTAPPGQPAPAGWPAPEGWPAPGDWPGQPGGPDQQPDGMGPPGWA